MKNKACYWAVPWST